MGYVVSHVLLYHIGAGLLSWPGLLFGVFGVFGGLISVPVARIRPSPADRWPSFRRRRAAPSENMASPLFP